MKEFQVQKLTRKILNRKVVEMIAISEKILGRQIGVKNSKTENWCKKQEVVNFSLENRYEKFQSEIEKNKTNG